MCYYLCRKKRRGAVHIFVYALSNSKKKKQLTIHRMPCGGDMLEEWGQGKLFNEPFIYFYFYSFILFI